MTAIRTEGTPASLADALGAVPIDRGSRGSSPAARALSRTGVSCRAGSRRPYAGRGAGRAGERRDHRAGTPEPGELAAALEIDLETYWQWQGAADGGVMVSFDAAAPCSRSALTLGETINDPEATLPGEELAGREEAQGLRHAIGMLPEKERTVLAMYYYEELNLRQIAEVLHVTESRVSQIRTQAIRRLRERLTLQGDSRLSREESDAVSCRAR